MCQAFYWVLAPLGTLSDWFAAVFSPRALYNVYNERCWGFISFSKDQRICRLLLNKQLPETKIFGRISNPQLEINLYQSVRIWPGKPNTATAEPCQFRLMAFKSIKKAFWAYMKEVGGSFLHCFEHVLVPQIWSIPVALSLPRESCRAICLSDACRVDSFSSQLSGVAWHSV